MKLKVLNRATNKKSESNKIRREGNIPCVIYQKGKEGQAACVSSAEFEGYLRKVEPGRLSTTVFTLEGEAGERRTIIKEIQYNPINYKVIHLDFEELVDGVEVNVKIPIEFTGVADCVGVKLGGVIRQPIRHLRVRCLPKDMPTAFFLDVKDLAQRESRRLSDLEIPHTVRPLANMNEVAVVIVKR